MKKLNILLIAALVVIDIILSVLLLSFLKKAKRIRIAL